MVKMVFFDVDGTLFSHRTKRFIPSAIEAIHKLQNNGVVWMVCSGRFPSEINDDLRQIGFDGYVMVDGALVEYKGDFVLKEAFTEKEMNYMVEQLHSHNCNFSYFHDNLTCFDPVPVPDHAAWMENVVFQYNVRSLEVTDETYKI